MYLQILSVKYTGVHVVDGWREQMRRSKTAKGYGDYITALHTQY